MNWNDAQRTRPPETDSYLVSISKQMSTGQYVFKYVAHYDSESNLWYKYDPFDYNFKPTEQIVDRITGWLDSPGVFLS